MIVSGKQNAITCSSPSGLKLRTPRIDSLLIDAMASCGGQYTANRFDFQPPSLFVVRAGVILGSAWARIVKPI